MSNESVELLVDRTEGWPAGWYPARRCGFAIFGTPTGACEISLVALARLANILATRFWRCSRPRSGTSWCAPRCRRVSHRSCVTRFSVARTRLAGARGARALSNMFLVALDARGEWYRYHHLFGEFLQLELGARERGRAASPRRGLVSGARARGGRDRVRRGCWGRGDGGRGADRAPPRVHLGRAARAVPWVGALASRRAAVEHPVLPGAGAVAAALLSAPEVEVHRLLAVAERARRERPELWLPYLEVGVKRPVRR